MAEPILTAVEVVPQPVDREQFSLHPEEHVTERPSHRLQVNYIEYALRRLLPDWFVAGNMGVYWLPGEMEYPSVGPDVLVAGRRPAREDPSVFLTHEDGPLTLVVEVASPATRKMDRRKRDEVYAIELEVPWYLWIDLPRHVLELDRLDGGRYESVVADGEGRVLCTELDVRFGWQADGRLVRVIAPDGTTVLTPDEEAVQREAEAGLRRFAEERAAREARRAEREAARRAAAEQRAAELAAEVERLRQALNETPLGDSNQGHE